MERESNRHKIFGRRAALLGGGQLVLATVLVGRMYYLQVVESAQYQMLADENRINMRLLPPLRGLVLDRFGSELARNRQNYQVVLVPEQANDVNETLDRLAQIVPINDRQRQRVMREVRRRRPFVPITLLENLTWEQFARLNVLLPDLAGVQPEVGETRHYPHGNETAHVVGYVSAVSDKELTGDPLLELPGFRIGKNGIERVFDESLRGKAGSQRVEVNAYGRVIRELARQDGVAGDSVVLSIDAELQESIARRLSEESSAAVVMDVHTGEVLAMVSTPAYDPNAFSMGLTSQAWRELVEHPRAPLTNKAVSGQYPPGSTFKMIVALAGLEAGVVNPEHRVFCNGVTTLGKTKFHCWRNRYGGHGWQNMRQAIAESCDVYFYDLARRLGVERIAAMAERFGLGRQLFVELPGEKPGLVPTPEWKQAVMGTPWQLGETLITGIGQAYLLATPLQLATMTARLGNGGFAVRPRLIRDAGAVGPSEIDEPARAPSIGVSRRNLEFILEAMTDVVHGERGTARAAKLDEDVGARMAGKTGTAQVRRITKAERQSGGKQADDTPWRERHHALFVALAPAEAPRYALALVIEHGQSGGYAATVSKDIMAAVMRRDPSRRPALGRVAASTPPPQGQGI